MDKSFTSFEGVPLTLRVGEVAAILNIGRNTAYELVRSGAIESVKVGRQIRITKQAVFRYLNHFGEPPNHNFSLPFQGIQGKI